jgi:asparagine synthase (glutamine-hydrolysing)
MCGIAGWIDFAGGVDRGRLASMVDALQHRGPDAWGIESDRVAGLAHARLRILDLSGGRQPMATPDGRFCITFNGEIFNYRELREELSARGFAFRTTSDTEVLLQSYAAWGADCVSRLNGDFAFAVWDARQQELFAARDRAGVRPLYYTQARDGFLFASEVKALLAHPAVERRLNLASLKDIFTLWGPTSPETVFEDIYELPPAHWLRLRDGRLEVQRYWEPRWEPPLPSDANDIESAMERLEQLLLAATSDRLWADVPVGSYLSGGLDSSLIAALAQKLTLGKLRTFSIAFSDSEFDESSFQSEMAQVLDTEHQTVRCSAADIGRAFPDVIRHTERPILRTAPAPMFLLARAVREAGLKVVLTGEGADEVCGGYDIFKEARVRAFWARQPGSELRAALLSRLYPYQPQMQRQSAAYRQAFFTATPADLNDPFFSHRPRWNHAPRWSVFFSADVLASWADDDPEARLAAGLPAGFADHDPFTRAQILEWSHLLPAYILSSQGDRMAMAHGVEGRFPFLDVRLVDWAARWPRGWKLCGLREKHLLKRVAQRWTPRRIVERSKQPYRAPDAAAFFPPERDGAGWDYVEELLSPDRIQSDGVFHAPAVDRLVGKLRRNPSGSISDQMALVGIVSTQLLIDQFLRGPRPATAHRSSLREKALHHAPGGP